MDTNMNERIVRHRLPSGLTLLIEEYHEAPVVALQAWVSVGSSHETEHEAGIAHLHEHMLFKGTTCRGVGEIAHAIESSGGEINAWTSFDQTVYHVVVASSELAVGLDVLCDALQNSSFDPQELARETEVIVEEIKRAHDQPERRLMNAMFETAFLEHPYRRPILGSEASVLGFTRKDVVSFFKKHYRPENITLVLVGDFVTADLIRQVDSTLGSWRPEDPPVEQGVRPVEKFFLQPRVRILSEDVKEARFSLAWPIPPIKHEDTAALDILATALGHGDSSRLYIETRRRQELVNDVGSCTYTLHDAGLFVVSADLRAESMTKALHSVFSETYRLRHQLLGVDELAKAKMILLSETAYQRETVQGESQRLGFYEVATGDFAFEEEYRKLLSALTSQEVREVANRYLTAGVAAVVQMPQEGNTLTEADIEKVIQTSFESSYHAISKGSSLKQHERLELPGGTVLLIHESNAPIVAMRAVALGGQRYETPHRAGIGTLFSSQLGLATASFEPETFAGQVAALGGGIGAFSGRNTIGLRGEFIAETSLPGLALFCDALFRPSFTEEDLERERAVLLERIRTRDDNPARVAFELFAETLYPHHPYGLRLMGTLETVQSFTLDDITAYFNTFLSPGQMVIALEGGMDGARAVEILTDLLKESSKNPLPSLHKPDERPKELRHVRYPLDKKQAHLVVGGMGTTVYEEERYALEVLVTILSGQSGRLFVDLRDKQSLAYSVSMSSLDGLDPGHVMAHLGTSPDKVEQALKALYQHFDAVTEHYVSDDELDRAKRYLIGANAIELQRAGTRAMQKALGDRFGQGYLHYLQFPEQISAVTKERVQQAAARFLNKNELVEVVVGPRGCP